MASAIKVTPRFSLLKETAILKDFLKLFFSFKLKNLEALTFSAPSSGSVCASQSAFLPSRSGSADDVPIAVLSADLRCCLVLLQTPERLMRPSVSRYRCCLGASVV